MVSTNDDHDCEVCPACRLRAALAEHLADLAAGREAAWHDATTGITAMLGVASSAMASMRATRFAGRPGAARAMADDAAAALVALAGKVQELRELLVDDDDQGDDE